MEEKSILKNINLVFATARDILLIIFTIVAIKFLLLLSGNFFVILKYLIRLAEEL